MKRCVGGMILMLLLFTGTGFSQSEKSLTVEEQLQRQLDELKTLLEKQNAVIEDQNARIEELESNASSVPVLSDLVASGKADAWLPSIKHERFKLGGELEFEYKFAEEDRSMETVANGALSPSNGISHSTTFDLDKANIYLKAQWNDVISTFFEIEFFESDAHVDTAWAQFDFVKSDENSFFVRTGLDHQFTKYSRTTENYPLAGGIFWRDEYNQVRLHGEHAFGAEYKWLYWDAVVGNSYNLDDTNSAISENPFNVNEVLQDDNDDQRDFDGHFQYGIGVGVKPDLKTFGNLDARVWWITSELRDDDPGSGLDQITDEFFTDNGLPTRVNPTDATPGLNLPARAGKDTDKNQLGFRLIYDKKFWDDKAHFKTIFEYIKAEDGPVDRDVWYVEGSMKFKMDGFTVGKDEKWITSIQPFVRYEELDIDDSYDNQFAAPVTWDRDRLIFGTNIGIAKNAKLRFEYSINGEDIDHAAGGRLGDSTIKDVDNDEFLIQLELKF